MPAHLIEVTPAQIPGQEVTWTLCYKNINVCGGPSNFPAVVLGQNTGAQVIIVNINDPSNLGISFPAKVEDALWIQADDKPTGPVLEPHSQIAQVTLANKSTLVFLDKNKGSEKLLKYQLNFVGADNKKVTEIDPDIRNGGGTGKTLFGAAEATALLIGAAVGITVATLWFRRTTAKRNIAS